MSKIAAIVDIPKESVYKRIQLGIFGGVEVKTEKHNFMSLQVGEKFRHIDFDDERIFTKVTQGRYRDQFGFEDFMMDALSERCIKVTETE